MQKIARKQRGDTIIEVMFAFVIFSMVAIGAIMLMNQGIAMAQRSLEITLVRDQIDAQVTMVKYLQYHDQEGWKKFLADNLADGTPSFDTIVTTDEQTKTKGCPASSNLEKAFFLTKKDTATVQARKIDPTNFFKAPSYSTADYAVAGNAYGLWAHITRAEGGTSMGKSSAYDLYVRACWDSVGSKEPVTIGTVTRLYDVR